LGVKGPQPPGPGHHRPPSRRPSADRSAAPPRRRQGLAPRVQRSPWCGRSSTSPRFMARAPAPRTPTTPPRPGHARPQKRM